MGDRRWGPTEAERELAALEQTLCGGHLEGFDAYLAELGSKGQSPCTTVWIKDTLAYRCRTCQVNDSSAICIKCFDSTIHSGHEYVIYRSPAGGCCDCGDPAAWKEDGFCHAHRGLEGQLEATVPAELVDVTHSTVRSIILQLVRCVDALSVEQNAEGSPNGSTISTLITWLQKVCGVAAFRNIVCEEMWKELEEVPIDASPQRVTNAAGAGDDSPWPRLPKAGRCVRMFGPQICGASAFRNIVCKEMYDSDESRDEDQSTITMDWKTPLQFLLSRFVYMSEDLIEKELTLFLLMLYNHRFKDTFSKELIKHYPGMFLPAINGRIKDEQYKALESLERVMVQLFNVPDVTLSLVKSDGLLECFVSVLGSIVSACADRNTGIVDVTRTAIEKRIYSRPIGDLRLVLSHSVVAFYVLNNRDDLLRIFLTILAALQWMHPYDHNSIPNLDDENFAWAAPIILEMNMASVVVPLLGSGGQHFGSMTEIPATPETSRAMLKAGRIIVAALTEWLEKEKTAFEDNFDVGSRPMSQHIPLHRMCAQLIARLTVLPHPSGDLSKSALESFLQPEEAYDMVGPFMAHPLRIQVWMAQIRSGEWVLQGEDLPRLEKIYRSSYWHDGSMDMDLLLIQYCATFNEARAFVSMLKAFKLLGIVLSPPIHKSNQEKVHRLLTRLQEFLRLVMLVVRERRNTGMSEVEYLRYETVQWLCVRDQTYSTLTESISKSLGVNSHLDAVLKDVAVYHVPKLQERGYYQLKPMYWTEFDTLFAHFSKNNLEEAQERALSVGKVEKPWRPKMPPLPKKPFDRLPDLLHTKACHAVFWSALQYANMYIREVAHSIVAESLAVGVLQLMAMVLLDKRHPSLRTGMEEPLSQQDMLIAQSFSTNDLAKNINESPRHLRMATHLLDAPKSILEMLKNLRSASDSACLVDCIDYVFELLHADAAPSVQAGSIAGTAEMKIPEASGRAGKDRQLLKKQRQAAILAQFAARQQAFIAQAELEPEEIVVDQEEESLPELPSSPSSPLLKRIRTPPVSPRSSSVTLHECAFCRGECGADGKAAGWISLVQRYKMPAVVLLRAQPVGSLEEASTVAEELQNRTGREGDAEETGSWLTTVTGAEAEGVAFSGPGEIDSQETIHVQCCGHQMHMECFQIYSDSLVRRHAGRRSYEGRGIIDLERVDYLCPICRRLANTLLPVAGFGAEYVAKRLQVVEANKEVVSPVGPSESSTLGHGVKAEGASLSSGFWEEEKGLKAVMELFAVQCASVASRFKGQPPVLNGTALNRMLWRVLATNVAHCEVLSRGGMFPPTMVGSLASTSAVGALTGGNVDLRDYMLARWGGVRTHWTALIELGFLAALSNTLPGQGEELEEENRTIREWLQLGRRGGPGPVEKSLRLLSKLLEDTGVRPISRGGPTTSVNRSHSSHAPIGGHGGGGGRNAGGPAAVREWAMNIRAEILHPDEAWGDLSDEDEDFLDAEWEAGGGGVEQHMTREGGSPAMPGPLPPNAPAPAPNPPEPNNGLQSEEDNINDRMEERGDVAGGRVLREGGGGTAGAVRDAVAGTGNSGVGEVEGNGSHVGVGEQGGEGGTPVRWRTIPIVGLPANLQLAAAIALERHGGRGVSAGIAEGGVSDDEEMEEAGPQGHGWIGGAGSPPWLARGVVLDVDPFLLLVALLMSTKGVMTKEKALAVVRLVFPVVVARAFVALGLLVEDKSEIGPAKLPIIEAACLSFLRRAAILVEVICGSMAGGITALGPPLPGHGPPDFAALVSSLQLPSLQQVLADINAVPESSARGEARKSLLHWWRHDAADTSWRPPVFRKVPRQLSLAKLPEVFQELLLQTVKQPCKTCKSVPREPAVCLICGELLCCATRCCAVARSGECFLHAEQENAGVGMFLLMKSTTLVLIRGLRVCMAPSLYLDMHGEEDTHLRRNQPLHLSQLRLNEVTRLWASAGLDYVSQILHQSQLGASVL